MIETTYIRLEKAAEMLCTDVDTLIVAAIEGRVSLCGLLNKYRRVALRKTDGEHIPDTVEEGRRFFMFVPIDRFAIAGLLTKDEAGPIFHLSSSDANGEYWEDLECWDVENPTAIGFDRRLIFIRRKDVCSIRDGGATPNKGAPPGPPEIPDRSYVSDSLALTNQAARKYWANANRSDATTHPSNKDVAAWLKEKGLSQSQAEKAASIIRPDWAHVGRKPDQ